MIYDLVFDHAHIGMLILSPDENFTILECNKFHNTITNMKREDVIGKSVFDVFPQPNKQQGERLLASFRKALTGVVDTMPILRYDIQNDDGTWTEKYWNVDNVPIYQDGKIIGILNQALDISSVAKAINSLKK